MSDCGKLEADQPQWKGKTATLTFTFTDSNSCGMFDWKMYTDDWVDVVTGEKCMILDDGHSSILKIINSSNADARNYAVQCCGKGFSNIISLKLTGTSRYISTCNRN